MSDITDRYDSQRNLLLMSLAQAAQNGGRDPHTGVIFGPATAAALTEQIKAGKGMVAIDTEDAAMHGYNEPTSAL
jgi:hypothetical protein